MYLEVPVCHIHVVQVCNSEGDGMDNFCSLCGMIQKTVLVLKCS